MGELKKIRHASHEKVRSITKILPEESELAQDLTSVSATLSGKDGLEPADVVVKFEKSLKMVATAHSTVINDTVWAAMEDAWVSELETMADALTAALDRVSEKLANLPEQMPLARTQVQNLLKELEEQVALGHKIAKARVGASDTPDAAPSDEADLT